ncbi:response regulator transcription factor (plasmid) [Cytobacillus spongiae]|uniref:response regulator transcription factor n=1 Tax=Cytobacillus spongiae TaxID=2901381 RepID=UPI00145FB751|nr:response regulator transcription factor [Cytobacillus spongiae]MCA1062856.1 response regulator transcription factor [Rossellomorea aquimaris]NMH70189.1 response regulator transcription factor [Bacillus sp. RO3]UII58465.1 response regulator transcription factor [Cytobacillus spongiae]WJV28508.1 response regulator transcription factor [Rossellomorea sp. AcN35-11]
MKKWNVLIVDDEPDMRQLIKLYLNNEQYFCIDAENGLDALDQMKKTQVDIMVVDIMMPFMDGYQLLKEVRERSQVPFIFLSAKGDDLDKVKGLKLGSDDYMVKPFNAEELVARIETILRRSYGNQTSHHPMIERYGPVSFNLASRTVSVDDLSPRLTLKEYELFLFLARNHGRVYTREQLLDQVWGRDYEGSDRTVDTHIKTLRLKLKNFGHLIVTVWGLGYKFEESS